MIRIGGLVVVRLVATDTGGWQLPVITAIMTSVTGYSGMRTGQWIIIIVDCECRRFPARVRRVTVGTGGGYSGCYVVGIVRLVISSLVATHTGVGYLVGVIAVMTSITGNGRVTSCQRIIIIMDGESGRSPARIGRVTIGAGSGYAGRYVIRIVCLVICCLVASRTGIRRVHVIAVMTGGTGSGKMATSQYIIIIVDCECRRFPARVRCMAVNTGVGDVLHQMIRIG
jgi:hypothetical protein